MTRHLAKCEWCGTVVPVASAAEAATWLRGHDCPEAARVRAENDADRLARDLRSVLTRVGMTYFSQNLMDGVAAEVAWETLDAHDAAVAARRSSDA